MSAQEDNHNFFPDQQRNYMKLLSYLQKIIIKLKIKN